MAVAQKKEAAPARRKWRDMSAAEMKAAMSRLEVSPEQKAAVRAKAAEAADLARLERRKPVGMKPGTPIRVHITGWQHGERPAEVVSDNISATAPRTITAKRLHRNGSEERVTVRFENVSLWRG